MTRRFAPLASASLAAFLASTALAGSGLSISEIRTGQPGPDTDEYIEIRGEPGTVIGNVFYVVIGDDNFAGAPLQNGVIEAVVNLTGITIPASGYLVIAEATLNPALGTANVVTTLNFEDNDNVTHLLVTDLFAPVGTSVDQDLNGELDPVLPWSSILSSVALVNIPNPDGFSADFVYSDTVIGPDGLGNVPQHVYSCDNDPTVWNIASEDPTAGTDTLGAANPKCVSTAAPLRISELRVDQPSTDNDEYFEISGEPGTSLAGYTFLAVGDGTGGSGQVEALVDLSSLVIPADGYLLVAEPTFTLGGATPDFVTGATTLNFENGDNVTFLLVKDYTGTATTDLDTNNDGTLDLTPWSELTDSVAIIVGTPGAGTNEFVYSPVVLGPDGGFSPSHVYRCDPFGDWKIGAFDPGLSVDSPGAANFGCPSCGGNGSCFTAHAGAGCDIVECCEAVCAVDPTCCTTGWDADCASQASTICGASGAAPAVTINEVRISQADADNDEFVEIKGKPGTSLAGAAYVVIGDGVDASGVVESVSLLSGSIPADGLFLLARSTFTNGNPDLIRDSINFEDGDTVTHLIVWNFNGFLGQDLDTNNDCTLDITPWSSVIDGIVLANPDVACGYAATVVGPDGSFPPAHSFKCEPTGAWTIGSFSSLTSDTPGSLNAICPEPSPCGNPSLADCFTASRVGGCSDAACCEAVCTIDPTCCDSAWDAACVAEANANCLASEAPAVALSEIRSDQPGADNDEYVEILGAAGTNLTGVTYVIIGDGSAAQASGVVEQAISLGGQMIPADGFFLIGRSSLTLGGAIPDLVLGSSFSIENGDNLTHLLVWDWSGSVGDDLDTNNDGVLDTTPWAEVIDSVAVVVDAAVPPVSSEWVYSTTIVGPDGTFVPSHIKFCPTTSLWTLGTFAPASSDDTPGLPNTDCDYSEPACVGDLDGSGSVDAGDLATLLGAWDGTGAADLDGSGSVDAGDLATLLGAWGECP
jgi:hypothetical protein